jgi:hypothetical protein
MAQKPSEMTVNDIATMMGNAAVGSAKHTEMAARINSSAGHCTNEMLQSTCSGRLSGLRSLQG